MASYEQKGTLGCFDKDLSPGPFAYLLLSTLHQCKIIGMDAGSIAGNKSFLAVFICKITWALQKLDFTSLILSCSLQVPNGSIPAQMHILLLFIRCFFIRCV
jgi:hypothetical protein